MDIVRGLYMQFHVPSEDSLCGKHRYLRVCIALLFLDSVVCKQGIQNN